MTAQCNTSSCTTEFDACMIVCGSNHGCSCGCYSACYNCGYELACDADYTGNVYAQCTAYGCNAMICGGFPPYTNTSMQSSTGSDCPEGYCWLTEIFDSCTANYNSVIADDCNFQAIPDITDDEFYCYCRAKGTYYLCLLESPCCEQASGWVLDSCFDAQFNDLSCTSAQCYGSSGSGIQWMLSFFF